MCHIGTWSTRYCMRTAEKVWRSKVKKNVVCRVSGEDTRQRVNGGCRPLTAATLCRVFRFAECPTLSKPGLYRVLLFAECSALDKPPLCRVPFVCWVLSLWPSANSLFAECYCLPSARHSTNHLFTECKLFAECFLFGIRQIAPLPSAR